MYRVDAKLPVKEIRQSSSLKLLGRRDGRVIREREQSKSGVAQSAQGLGHFRMGGHRGDRLLDGKRVLRANGLTARVSHHLENRPSELVKRRILAHEGERLGIQDQLRKPLPHHAAVPEDSRKVRPQRFKIK
jgi:hypothetical protein